MSAERQVMQDYIDALVKRADFTRYFTEDVIATFEGTDQRADGRAAAGQLMLLLGAHEEDRWTTRV